MDGLCLNVDVVSGVIGYASSGKMDAWKCSSHVNVVRWDAVIRDEVMVDSVIL